MPTSDIEYAKYRLQEELDKIAIPDDLRLSINMLLHFTLESEDSLKESIDAIAMSKGAKRLVLERSVAYGNENIRNR